MGGWDGKKKERKTGTDSVAEDGMGRWRKERERAERQLVMLDKTHPESALIKKNTELKKLTKS